jgi:hypothetical protein
VLLLVISLLSLFCSALFSFPSILASANSVRLWTSRIEFNAGCCVLVASTREGGTEDSRRATVAAPCGRLEGGAARTRGSRTGSLTLSPLCSP